MKMVICSLLFEWLHCMIHSRCYRNDVSYSQIHVYFNVVSFQHSCKLPYEPHYEVSHSDELILITTIAENY